MKSKIILFLAIASMFVLQSCEEDLLNINESFYYESEFEVLSPDSITMISVSELVDMSAQDSLINKYKDKIQTVEISDVNYWITDFVGSDDQQITEATLKVATENGSNEQLITTIQNQILSAIQEKENSVVLVVEQAGIDQMANLIKNDPYKFQLLFAGEGNEAPLNFTIHFNFKVNIVANPL